MFACVLIGRAGWADGSSFVGRPDCYLDARLSTLEPIGCNTPGTDGDWSTPARSVFRKDFRLGGQLIETRLMMKQSNGDWAGYSYEWNTGQTDATLVAAGSLAATQRDSDVELF